MNDAAVLWDVVDEHLDEAEFLLEQWLSTTRSPRFSREHLQAKLETRLNAHLDALLVGGAAVAEQKLWPLVGPESEGPPLRVAAAGLALLLDPALAPPRLAQALVGGKNPLVREGLGRAFQLSPREDLDEPLRLALYEAAEPAEQAALLGALGSRRVDPGPILGTLLESAEPALLRAALAASSAARPGSFRHLLEAHLQHPDAGVRAAAIRSGLVWNLHGAWRACLLEARSGGPEAMVLAALLGGPEQVPALAAALATPERRPAALWALGFTGRPEAVEACLPVLSDPEAAGLAVEAIAGITGLPLFDEPFAQPAPEAEEDEELPPLEEDLRSDLTPAPADELPAPDAEQVRAWWAEARGRFPSGRRFLAGQPLSPPALAAALSTGPLRRIDPLACELAIRSAGSMQLPALRLAQPPLLIRPDFPLLREPSWR